MAIRNQLRLAASAVVLALAALAGGCSLGFISLRPGENSGLYQHLFADIINNYDEPHWLWVRGSIMGDLDGDGEADEEIVLATIQKGDAGQPEPIEMAFLVACDVSTDGRRTAIARILLFDSSPIPGAPKPDNDLGIVRDQPFTHCLAQMIQDKITLTETVVVYFWSDPMPSSAWYAGFALKDGNWSKNLETVLWQDTPGFLSVNFDRSVEASPNGYQLVFRVASVPEAILRKVTEPGEAPLWGHVFARNAGGGYEQADSRYGDQYRRIEGRWNEAYLKASLKGIPPEEIAWLEYHLGLLNRYTGDTEMSEAFMDRAARHAKDPILVRAVQNAIKLIGRKPAE